jgi:hypothetical protein
MSPLERVLEAAERRANELLGQASNYEQLGMPSVAEETMREHYRPLRDAITKVRGIM